MAEPIHFDAELAGPFEAAVERVVAALKTEGFGVLTRIDVHRAFHEKLGVEFRPYAILGACNPGLAHRALSSRPEAGLMLPCNVTVEEEPGGACRVRIADPEAMMATGGFADDASLAQVGSEARARLLRVAAALRSGGR